MTPLSATGKTAVRLLATPLLGLLAVVSGASGDEAGIPLGIYSSGGPTNAFNNSVDSRLAGRGYVDGALVRIGWGDIETAPGVYDWTRLDDQFSRAKSLGLKISLAVVNGRASPSWLEDQGAQTFSYSFRGTPSKMPVPWDAVFLNRWTTFVGAVGARYNGDPSLALVHITTSSGNGFEMQLPSTPTDIANWNAIGYTVEKEVNAYRQVIDAFATGFPAHLLDVEVHPVLNSDSVAQQVVAYGNQTLGDRFGVFAAWWSQHNADDIYQGMYQLLRDQAAATFATVQFVTNATTNPNGFGTGGFEEALDRAFADGVKYFEIWDIDVLNDTLAPAISALRDEIVSSVAMLHGDYNLDGVVDASDYTIWRDGFGTKYTLADYVVWKTHFGENVPMLGSAALAAVPEPPSLVLLIGCGVIAAFPKRR